MWVSAAAGGPHGAAWRTHSRGALCLEMDGVTWGDRGGRWADGKWGKGWEGVLPLPLRPEEAKSGSDSTGGGGCGGPPALFPLPGCGEG